LAYTAGKGGGRCLSLFRQHAINLSGFSDLGGDSNSFIA
jgi:hypothetical protein